MQGRAYVTHVLRLGVSMRKEDAQQGGLSLSVREQLIARVSECKEDSLQG